MQKGRYFKIDEKERKEIEKAYHSIRIYKFACLHAKGRGEEITKEEVKRYALGRKEDATKYLGRGLDVTYRAFIGGQPVDSISLLDCLMVGTDPFGILHQRNLLFTDRNIDCIIGGHSFDEHAAISIADSALKVAREDGNFRWLWQQREHVIQELIEPLEEMLRERI